MKVTILEEDDLVEAINHLNTIPSVEHVTVDDMCFHMGTDDAGKQAIIIENSSYGFYITEQK